MLACLPRTAHIQKRSLMEATAAQAIELLQSSELFAQMSKSTLKIVAEHAECCEYVENERIFEAATGQGALYVVRSGRVAIARAGEDGKERVLASYIAGESFGELDLVAEKHDDTAAFAESDAVLLRFPREGAGIDDFLGAHPDVGARLLHDLLALVARRIRATNNLISERSPWIQELRNQVLLDKLTGLYNTTYLKEDFPKLLASGEGGTSLLVLKPDNFKLINDGFGHDAGDRTLRAMGEALRSNLELSEVAVRYKGDVFAAILPKADIAEASERAEKLRAVFEELDLSSAIGDDSVSLTVSIGIAKYPDHAQASEALVERAYETMFVAQEAGGNRVLVTE